MTSTVWFEAFIMANILMVGICTGLDVENRDGNPGVTAFVDVVSVVTSAVFTIECVLKIVAEGKKPGRYFTDPNDGVFNTMDFGIVLVSYAFMGSSSASTIVVLRMLRLARLLTLIKGVQQLRVIVSGLITVSSSCRRLRNEKPRVEMC